MNSEKNISENPLNEAMAKEVSDQETDHRDLKLNDEINALKEQVLRALAEADNIRKRADREKADLGKYIISNFARDLLSVADNLSRALSAIDPDQYKDDPLVSALISGIQMTDQTFHQILEKNGIQKINALGQKFDSNFHQAMAEQSKKDVEPGTIVEVYQTGYMIQDRLLRPAMVAVSKP